MQNAAPRPIKIALAGTIALTVGMGLSRFAYTPILPHMVEELKLTNPNAGLIASVNLLGYFLGAIASSRAALPGGNRTWTIGSLLVNAFATLAMGFVSTLPLFLIIRFIAGMSTALMVVFGTNLVLNELVRADRPKLSSLYFSGPGWGIVLSAVLVPVIIIGSGWAGLWISSGVFALLGAALAVWMIHDSPDVRLTTTPAASPAAAKTKLGRRLVALIAAFGLFGFGYIITGTFLSTMIRTTPELRTIEPFAWLLVGIFAIPSVGFWAWCGQKLGNNWALCLACLVEFLGVILGAFSTNLGIVIVAAILYGGTINSIAALAMVHARELCKTDPRPVLGLLAVSVGLGQIIGPIFAGYVAQATGDFHLPSLAAALMLLMAGGLVIIWRD